MTSHTHTDLHLLVSIFGGVLAALALPAQFLQLRLTLLQTLPFALVLHLVLLQRSLRGAAQSQQGHRWYSRLTYIHFKLLWQVVSSRLTEGSWCIGYFSLSCSCSFCYWFWTLQLGRSNSDWTGPEQDRSTVTRRLKCVIANTKIW